MPYLEETPSSDLLFLLLSDQELNPYSVHFHCIASITVLGRVPISFFFSPSLSWEGPFGSSGTQVQVLYLMVQVNSTQPQSPKVCPAVLKNVK